MELYCIVVEMEVVQMKDSNQECKIRFGARMIMHMNPFFLFEHKKIISGVY